MSACLPFLNIPPYARGLAIQELLLSGKPAAAEWRCYGPGRGDLEGRGKTGQSIRTRQRDEAWQRTGHFGAGGEQRAGHTR